MLKVIESNPNNEHHFVYNMLRRVGLMCESNNTATVSDPPFIVDVAPIDEARGFIDEQAIRGKNHWTEYGESFFVSSVRTKIALNRKKLEMEICQNIGNVIRSEKTDTERWDFRKHGNFY